MLSVVNIAVLDIVKSFKFNVEELNFVISIFLIFFAVFIFFMGKFFDIFDRIKIFKIGFLLFIFLILMCVFLNMVEIFFVFCVL